MLGRKLVKLLMFLSLLVGCWVAFKVFQVKHVSGLRYEPLQEWRGARAHYHGNWSQKEHLLWFIQISDIHINIHGPKERYEDFETFCDDYIEMVKPTAVLVTGDLVDSKYNFFRGSGPVLKEWEMYHRVVQRVVSKNVTWLDIRGNHDASQVLTKRHCYYEVDRPPKLPVLGENYEAIFPTSFGSYRVLALDLVPAPGFIMPLNFFGVVTEETRKWASEKSKAGHHFNHTIWMTHYPHTVVSDGASSQFLASVSKSSIAFVNGHLHSNRRFYARGIETGNLFLEVGDWRDSRRFRLMAFDNDLFTFRDFTFSGDNQVLTLITNPKNHEYISPRLEPTARIVKSTHIRALVFTHLKVTEILVMIDNSAHCTYSGVNNGDIRFEEGVFTCRWDPTTLDYGSRHTIELIVVTDGFRVTKETHTFTLDGSHGDLLLLPSILLHYNLANVAFYMCVIGNFGFILLPLIMGIFPHWPICRVIYQFTALISPTFSLYFFTLANSWPMIAVSFINFVFPVGGLLQVLPDKRIVPTIFGTFLDGRRYVEPVVYIINIEQLLMINMPIYLHYFFRLCALEYSKVRRRLILTFVCRFITELLWLPSFLFILYFSFSRTIPITDTLVLVFSLSTYYPLIYILLRFHRVTCHRTY